MEPVSVVAEDLVRAWPRGAGAAAEVEEGRPEDELGRELVGAGPVTEFARAWGLFLVVMGGREVVVVEALVVVLWAGWRTEADLPSPKPPEMGLLRDVGTPLSSLLLTAIEAARVRREVDEVDVVDERPLRGSLLGETLRALLWSSVLGCASLFCLNSPPVGFRRDRDRDSNEDMATQLYGGVRLW